MAEAEGAPSTGGTSLTKGTIKVPGGGRIKKGYAMAGVAVVGVAVVIYYRNKKAAVPTADQLAASPTVDPTAPSDLSNFDPTAGGAGIIGYSSTGNPIYGVGTGPQVESGPPFSTNAAWSQYAITILVGNGMDSGPLTDALGAYIAGSPVTAAQHALINDAVAVAGYPPVAGTNGNPPGINVTQPSTGGTNPGGGNVGGSTSWKFPAPTGLQAYSISHTGYRLKWNAVKGPSGQTPASYTIRTYNSAGHEVDTFTVTGTSTAEYGRGGHGLPHGTYHTNVWANGGKIAPPHATVTVRIS